MRPPAIVVMSRTCRKQGGRPAVHRDTGTRAGSTARRGTRPFAVRANPAGGDTQVATPVGRLSGCLTTVPFRGGRGGARVGGVGAHVAGQPAPAAPAGPLPEGLSRPGIAPKVAETVLLVVSEPVTNALRHGGGTYTLRSSDRPDAIEVAVDDPSPERRDAWHTTDRRGRSSAGSPAEAFLVLVRELERRIASCSRTRATRNTWAFRTALAAVIHEAAGRGTAGHLRSRHGSAAGPPGPDRGRPGACAAWFMRTLVTPDTSVAAEVTGP